MLFILDLHESKFSPFINGRVEVSNKLDQVEIETFYFNKWSQMI